MWINSLRGLVIVLSVSGANQNATLNGYSLSERSAEGRSPVACPPPFGGREPRMLWKELRQAVARALDAELVHAVAKSVGMEIQDFRRTLRPFNHST